MIQVLYFEIQGFKISVTTWSEVLVVATNPAVVMFMYSLNNQLWTYGVSNTGEKY